jgi:hypothetical protein
MRAVSANASSLIYPYLRFSLNNPTNAGDLFSRRSRSADCCCPIALRLGINLVCHHIRVQMILVDQEIVR